MRSRQHVTIFGAVLLALIGAVFLREGVAAGSAVQPRESQPSGDVRIGTIDLYLVSERIMQQPRLVRAREEADQRFTERMRSIEEEARQMENRLQVLPQNDPQAQRLVERLQEMQTSYQDLHQERLTEMERINSRQLIDAYRQTRGAAEGVAQRQGYTHVFSSRGFDRPIKTETVGATLQEMLARPLIVGVEEDDLTQAVLDALDLDPPAPGQDEGGGPAIIPNEPNRDPGR